MFPSERVGSVSVAKLGGTYSSLDDAAVDETRSDLLALADACDPPFLIFDLTDVEYVSSMFLELLFRTHTRLKKRGGRFALCSPCDYLRNVLHVTRLDTVFCIHDTRDAATADLNETATLQPSGERN